MAKTKEVSFFVERKVSDGDYGSYGIHIGEVAIVEPGESFKEALAEVRARVQKAYKLEMKRLVRDT